MLLFVTQFAQVGTAIGVFIWTLFFLFAQWRQWQAERAEAPHRAEQVADHLFFKQMMAFVRGHREAGSQLEKVYLSYDNRDRYVRWCQDNRKFYNTLTTAAGEHAVSFDGIPFTPSIKIKGDQLIAVLKTAA